MTAPTPPPAALRLSAGAAALTVTATDPAVTDWLTRYLGSWWTVRDLPCPAAAPSTTATALHCRLDPDAYRATEQRIRRQHHQVVEFARNPVARLTCDGAVRAVDPAEQVAYHARRGAAVTLIGATRLGLCLAAARVARELVRVQLEDAGWVILHASAAARDGHAVLTLGPKGAGKTTTALLLATDGHQLLANDRVFLHPATLALLPWPSAAALGLGLLAAHDLLPGVRTRLAGGDQLHPTVDPAVIAAIRDGRTAPLLDDRGKELKPQFFPHQLTDWLGLRLARSATATALLFPRIDPGGEPHLDPRGRELGAEDFFDPASDDRYPDFLHLARVSPERRHQLWTQTTRRVAALPHRRLALTHDVAASRQLLADLSAM